MNKRTVILNDEYEKSVKRLIDTGIYQGFSEIVRAGIRKIYRTEFSESLAVGLIKDADPEQKKTVNHQQALDKALDKEEYCRVVLGGEVVDMEGRQYCQYMDGEMQTWIPLYKE